MRTCVPVSLFLVFVSFVSGYGQIPFPELIEKVKPSIVAVDVWADTTIDGCNQRYHGSGTGVLLHLREKGVYVVTNEHVVARAEEIYVSVNARSLGALQFRAELKKADERLDLAALQFRFSKELEDSVEAIAIPISMWEDESNIREGETILYSGYPLELGRGERNNPLTRSGIVSQRVPGKSTFYIDGFVQPGYSGSPVFVIRPVLSHVPPKWRWRFIGIAYAHPRYPIDVYREVGYRLIPGVNVLDNPGFSEVVGVSSVKKLFELE